MPIVAEFTTELPEAYKGEFIEFYFDEKSVTGAFKTVSEISKKRYLIETVDVVFIDSLYWVSQNMSPIIEVNLKSNYFEILTTNSRYTKNLSDTLSSKPIRKEFVLDFKEGSFYDEFIDNDLQEYSKRKCLLRSKNDKYYLNIEYSSERWLVSRIKMDGNKLEVGSLNFALLGEKEMEFKELQSKYNLERIRLKGNTTGRQYYLANSNDDEMERLLDEKLFAGFVWYKLGDDKSRWIFISIGMVALLGLIWYIIIVRKMKSLENNDIHHT